MAAPDEALLNVAVGGSVSGIIGTTGDTDDANVFLVAGQTYSVSLRGTGASAVRDTFLEVYDPSSALVNFDDDGGNDRFSILTFTASVTGNFTIRASALSHPSDPGTGGYTVDVRVQGADAVGDTNATAVVLSQGTTFGFRETATVSGGADLDRYQITLEAGKFYTFKVAAGADSATVYTAVPAGEIDTILRLRNDAGTLLAQNDDNKFPSDISSGFGFLATASGTYYLDVTGYAGQTGGYVIDFQEIDYENMDPLDAIRWESADNIDTVTVGSAQVAYVYFGAAGETFGESITTFGWNATEKAAVMSALLEFTKITGITYLETADINQAEFRLNTVNTGAFAAYSYPQDPVYGTQQGILIFNVNGGGWDKPGVSSQDIPGDQLSLDKGGFAYATILHEFGVAHGLAHPHADEGGSDVMLGVTAESNSYGLFNLNQGVYTIMSHNEAWDLHPDGASPFTIAGLGSGWSGTLSAFDIAVLQERYGVHAYNSGNNVYTLASVQQTGVYYETIWDSGGTDSIVYGGTGNARIDLTPASLNYSPTGGGALSFVDQIPGPAGVDGIFGGYTIANGVVIENATGGSGNDTLIGNAFANVLNGGAGVDTMAGGLGDDQYYVDSSTDVVNETGGQGTDRIYASSNYVLTAGLSIETLSTDNAATTTAITFFGNELANNLYGNAGSNGLYGSGGNDVLIAHDGDDILNGGAGVDTMAGGLGNDQYYIDTASDVVSEAAGLGTDRVFAGASYTLAAGVSVETLSTDNNAGTAAIALGGNEFANTVYGNAGNNSLFGGGGNDVLLGLEGDDTLTGGTGTDTMAGGLGNDSFYVDTSTDVVSEATGQGTDRIYAGASYVLVAGVSVETLSTTSATATTAINLTGNEIANNVYGNYGDNSLYGGGGNDVLIAHDGNDTLNGGAGTDTMAGGLGNDNFYVDSSTDVVNEAAGQGTDRIFTSSNYVLAAGISVETLSTDNNAGMTAITLVGNEIANNLYGNFGNNNLFGSNGNDVILALDGNDMLNGGGGADSLSGGAGADTFVFANAAGAGNIDTISDYNVADDVIHIDNAVFTGLAAGALAAGAFNTGAAATQADDRIIYNSATGALLFDVDGVGGAAAVQFAALSTGLAMTNAEFLVI